MKREKRPAKRPFDIERAIPLVREAVAAYPKAALFELASEGFDSLFEVLVACVISIRTRDETTMPVSRRLFAEARTPSKMAKLSLDAIDLLIGSCTFHGSKASTILELARRTVEDFDGELPCDAGVLTSFHGVGPKCANLALGIACGLPTIGVDIHVHRVTNRWGYVHTRTPEQTLAALERSLPPRYRVEINGLLVPFGKHVYTGVRPKCSTCPLLSMCRQVGVTSHR